MPNVIQIESVAYEQFISDLEQRLRPTDDLLGSSMIVDRKFLKLNFAWGRSIIENYEATGDLLPIWVASDTKTHYYKLQQAIELFRKQHLKLHNH